MIPIIFRKVKGHSMMPVLPPATMVYGLKWFRKLKVGDIVILVQDGKERIKRIDKIDEDKLYVLGDHDKTTADSQQYSHITIDQVVAKVVWPHAPKERAETNR